MGQLRNYEWEKFNQAIISSFYVTYVLNANLK
jgi:hypothetical protein